MVFNATFNNISVISWQVSLIAGGKRSTWRKPSNTKHFSIICRYLNLWNLEWNWKCANGLNRSNFKCERNSQVFKRLITFFKFYHHSHWHQNYLNKMCIFQTIFQRVIKRNQYWKRRFFKIISDLCKKENQTV